MFDGAGGGTARQTAQFGMLWIDGVNFALKVAFDEFGENLAAHRQGAI
jgi:hypothetical protein